MLYEKAAALAESPPQQGGEADRLAALQRYAKIVRSIGEDQFRDAVELAAVIFRTPMAAIGFMGSTKIWLKSSVGFEMDQIARDGSFCANTIMRRETFVVEDAAADRRFAANPLVTSDPGIRFYAGAPLMTPDGHALGTIFVLDRFPRPGAARAAPALERLARQAMARLESARRMAELEATKNALALDNPLYPVKNQLLALVQGLKECLFLANGGARISLWTRGAEGTFGYRTDEILGKSVAELISERDRTKFEKRIEELSRLAELTVASNRMEITGITGQRKDQSPFPASVSINLLRTGPSEVQFGFSVTDLSKSPGQSYEDAEHLRQIHKLEAIGRLAGGVAHDFNNLLTVIRGYADLYLMGSPPDEPRRAEIQEIRNASDRAAALTQQLLAFSRKQVLHPRVLDLEGVTHDASKMLGRLIGEDIDLVIRSTPDLGKVKADKGQIDQVIMNLAINARDAMPKGGKLTIELANADLDAAYLGQHPVVKAGPYVLMAVSDTGCGMDKETLSHLFEPFFTTKPQGQGTGMGLSTVYGIVKQSNGYIWAYSEPGRGTTFKIYLPRVEDEEAEWKADTQPFQAVEGTETILLVEDEAAIRSLAARLLERAGYRVLAAGHGAEALRLASAHTGDIHLLLTDVVMPGMGGPELAKKFSVHRPTAKVLYMSGYPDAAAVRSGVLEAGEQLLCKPFTRVELACKVRKVLEAA